MGSNINQVIITLENYNKMKIDESIIKFIFKYLENTFFLGIGINGSYDYLNYYYKNNNYEELRFSLVNELKHIDRISKEYIGKGEDFINASKLFELLKKLLRKIYDFITLIEYK